VDRNVVSVLVRVSGRGVVTLELVKPTFLTRFFFFFFLEKTR
jgi:hypothetical protein